MTETERTLVVTPGMLARGYRVLRGDTLDPHSLILDEQRFEVIRELPDGNYLVKDPTPRGQD